MTLELLLSVFLKLSIFMSCWLIFTRRTPSPQYFKGFKGTPSDFTSMLKQCLSDPQCSDLKSLDIPNDVYDVIAEYSIFWVALDRIMPNQEVYIEQCSDSNVVIAASKFNHLRMRQCRDMTVWLLLLLFLILIQSVLIFMSLWCAYRSLFHILCRNWSSLIVPILILYANPHATRIDSINAPKYE